MGDRVLAAGLDTAILMPAYAVAAYWIGIRYHSYRNGNVNLTGGPALLLIAIIMVIWIGYYTAGESFFGGTIGEHAASIEVRRTDSGSITFFQALIRNLLRPIDAIGFYLLGCLVALLSMHNQTIGDRASKTIVYEKEVARRGRAVALWVAVFFGSWILIYLIRHFAAPASF